MKNNKFIFIILSIISMSFYFIPPLKNYAGLLALLFGIILSILNIFYKPEMLNKYRKLVLNTAVIFFGFSLNIDTVIKVGSKGVVISFISLVVVLVSGFFLYKFFKIDKVVGLLISCGTSICGGSAISSISSVINPTAKQMGIGMAVVFILNGVALFISPMIGHAFNMTQEQFGTFAALSIHDVSSVTGAAQQFGDVALETATILKLTRTLWIIPIVLIISSLHKSDKKSKLPIPLFILAFIGASIITSILSSFGYESIKGLAMVGKVLLPLALFYVGYGINVADIKEIGVKGISFGVILWIISIITSLVLVFI